MESLPHAIHQRLVALREAIARVTRDLVVEEASIGGVNVAYEVQPTAREKLDGYRQAITDDTSSKWLEYGVVWDIVLRVGSVGTTAEVAYDGTEVALEAALVDVADRLQDEVIEAEQAARPKCPLHGHPLDASLRSAVAMWTCPACAWECRIGEYHRRRIETVGPGV